MKRIGFIAMSGARAHHAELTPAKKTDRDGMKEKPMRLKTVLVILLAGSLAGCAVTKGRPDLLGFMADGQTSKAEILSRLGEPSGIYEQEKILTYRLGVDFSGKGYFVKEREPVAPYSLGWKDVKYSLVLVFDGQNILRRHSLVAVAP